ncbi:hypothetical protein R1sor_014978 [Riccia sorocarpa]|uniref:Bms1-type G domain-containing protein n=1 Tax=Riccia sorocarpa TaxID=122646 RepID=A0ABD3HH42_9MARC
MGGGHKPQKNKAHKTKFASKSSRNVHKLAGDGPKGGGKAAARAQKNTSHGQRAKELRLLRTKNIRDHKRATLLAEKRANTGASCSPKILAIVALSSKVDVRLLKKWIVSTAPLAENGSENAPADDVMETEETSAVESGLVTVVVPRYKSRLTVIEAPRDDLQACLEVAKVADILAFAVAADDAEYVDRAGKVVLSMLRGAGLPSCTGFIANLAAVPAKKRADAKRAASAALAMELPEDSKCFATETVDDFNQMMRSLAEQRLAEPKWRTQRPYVVAQELTFSTTSPGSGALILSGYVRGRTLSVNQLVHVAGVGDFQFGQIDVVEDPAPLRQRRKQAGDAQMVVDDVEDKEGPFSVQPDPENQEPLIIENTPDTLAGEQTWPTEEELAEAGEENKKRLKKKLLPKGTSDYQAAWIVEDSDEDEDGVQDGDEDGSMKGASENEEGDEEGSGISEEEQMNVTSESVWGDDDDTQSEMMDEDNLTPAQRAAEIERLKAAHATDEEFPDEVDTPIDRPARERFAKYRGLKSFRTSPWDSKESLPLEYSKIFAFDNFARTQKHVLAKAAERDGKQLHGLIGPHTYVRLHIKNVPAKAAELLLSTFKQVPVVACALHQHETKMSVLHYSIKKYEGCAELIKSKDTLIFHTGFRRYTTRPIFSTDDMNVDKHKFERFLRPGQFALASVFAPVSYPPLPLVAFKEFPDGVKLVASGSLRSVNPDQIILKRIILSGYPHRVTKRKAVVRFMFHNPDDVRWFKPLELWTKYGRRGRIKEPVGTHGSMKCIFDGVPQQRDAVCVSLYKRVYPKWPCQ